MNDQFKKKPRGAARSERAEARPETVEAGERIAKRLARAGVASRREAESLIAAGRVRVNGKVLESPAVNVMPDDRIDLDNQPIPAIERTRLFLFHKPAGVVTTNRDPEGRRTVFDVLPDGLPRLMTIGRLDINTEGLLLLTNDGGLARVLELPQTGWLRRYRVRVHGRVDETALAGLRDGIAVDGVFYGAMEATLEREQGSNAWLSIGLREGKNREVKNVLGALGLEVNRLIRVSYGPFQLGELPEGAVHELKGRTLRDQLGERLIEEAGANFDAPVTTQFSNKPEVKGWAPAPKPQGSKLGPEGEGGLIKNRKRQRDDHRESMLGKLSTRAPGLRGGGKPAKREEKPYEPPRARSANVWMAPGARPVPAKKDDAEEPIGRAKPDRSKPRAADPNQRLRGRPAPERDAGGQDERPRRREGTRAPFADTGRDGTDARPARRFDNDRAPRRGDDGDKPFRPKRDWVKNPPRPGKAERAAHRSGDGEAPREYRPRGEGPARPPRPRSERPEGDRPPRREGGFAGKPRTPRSDNDRPAPRGERYGKPDGRPARNDGGPGKGFKPGPRKDGPRKGGPQKDGPRPQRPAGKGRPGADRRR